MNKTRLLLDFNHLASRCIFVDNEIFCEEPDFSLHKHILLTALFNVVGQFKPDEVIIAIDGRGNWRKSVYPLYKANRKIKRDGDLFPWEDYFVHLTQTIQEIKEMFPFKMIRIPKVEADDICGVLAKYLNKSKKNIIVTSDKDYIQLLQYKNVRLYDPVKKKWIEVDDPKRSLDIKILTGDSGDNVPNVKPRLGEKTAMKIMEDPDLFDALMEETYVKPIKLKDPKCKKHKWEEDDKLMKCEKCSSTGELIYTKDTYERNCKLIDLSMIPNAVVKEVIRRYEACVLPEYTAMNIMGYFGRCGLRNLNKDLSRIMMVLEPLVKPQENEFF